MLLTLKKWIDNLLWIPSKNFNLRCSKFIALKENTPTHSFQNHYSKSTKYPQEFSYREISKGENWGVTLRERLGGAGLLARLKVWTFPFCWISPLPKKWVPLSLLWLQTTYWRKKVSLIAFRPILPKILAAAYIFNKKIMAN